MLEVQEIHTYYGKSHILQGVTLKVEHGEVVCLLGRNGAGKTTTLKSIIGVTPPKNGIIKFEGKEIQKLPPYSISRMGIGYVPQDRRIFQDLTVEENLEVVWNKRSGIWDKEKIFEIFPELRNLRKRKGKNLSGGEQQMLAIARTLMLNPKLLLLDEPSEGLAPIIIKRIGELIKQIAQSGDMTILMSEQNLKFATSIADRVYIIDKGKIQYEGTVDELLENKELLSRYITI